MTAGALWTSLRDESEFESSTRSLVEQIKGAVPGSGGGMSDDEYDEVEERSTGADGGAELRAELERLRKATEAKPATKDTFTFDPDAPAKVPGVVPELPPDFNPTTAIRKLKQNLLHSTTPLLAGFYGMGGIGKTVTGAALARDADVRDHFDQIVWLPLGQTPVMEKLHSSAMQQLTGVAIESTLSEEERHAALRLAFKGKRVLLALDDMWEEEHLAQLNFVDESCGSRVLISTRIRHLLSDAFSVEIGKPSVDDSINILMAAAELSDTGHAPAEASEIVELCGRLPLALVMAGKLILELEVGSKWDGITSILREELRGDQQAASREQAVIRASLAGLKGSDRDTTGARNLFKLFGLVPEDTACPLECLQLLYDAVYESAKATSILHIRKWLKILIDRSLVLGTVDCASLHDLVLDFTISLHSKAELIAAHRRVVEMFRSKRPSVSRIAEWNAANRDEAVTAYVLDEAAHHVKQSRDNDNHTLLGWVLDQPLDALVSHVGVVLGEEALASAAEDAESAREMWIAACRWAVAANVAVYFRGTKAATEPFLRAADCLGKVEIGACAPRLLTKQKDQLELMVLSNLIRYDLTNLGMFKPRIDRLMSTEAAKTKPDFCYYIQFLTGMIPAWVTGTLESFASSPATLEVASIDMLSILVRSGIESAPDPAMREFCKVLLCHCNCFSFDMLLLLPDFDWSIYGDSGQWCREGLEAYDYDKHHYKMYDTINGDYMTMHMGVDLPLALHFGDIGAVDAAFDKLQDSTARMLTEPNQGPEITNRINMMFFCFWPTLLGKGTQMASTMGKTIGTSFNAIGKHPLLSLCFRPTRFVCDLP